MLLYTCDHGHTTLDNWDDHILAYETELEAEINDDWSGMTWSYWETKDGYQRPNIFSEDDDDNTHPLF